MFHLKYFMLTSLVVLRLPRGMDQSQIHCSVTSSSVLSGLRRVRLVLGWVTVRGRVNHLGM